jgi:hypothetical protein
MLGRPLPGQFPAVSERAQPITTQLWVKSIVALEKLGSSLRLSKALLP